MTDSTTAVLAELLRQADLPDAVTVRQLTGRGFDNEVHVAQLTNGRRVVLRRWTTPREPERARAFFLQTHGVPAPSLLASCAYASLHDFVEGELLGDLIEAGRAPAAVWRRVGDAYRRVHAVRFPSGLFGELHPDRLVLQPIDPVQQMHTWIEEAEPGLRPRAPDALDHLAGLHEIVDSAAASLRMAPTALGHGDINMWNIIVADDRAWLIDWDEPRVRDPSMEIALLDKHVSLFNRQGVDAAFFEGYGGPPPEPNTSLHRVVQTVRWAASSDWAPFEQQNLSADLSARTHMWLQVLLVYVGQLPAHVARLRRLV